MPWLSLQQFVAKALLYDGYLKCLLRPEDLLLTCCKKDVPVEVMVYPGKEETELLRSP